MYSFLSNKKKLSLSYPVLFPTHVVMYQIVINIIEKITKQPLNDNETNVNI